MAKHLVKCIYCKETFDANVIPYELVSNRRYAHASCAETEKKKITKEERDKLMLEEYIKKLLNEDFINPKVRKQIKEYHDELHYTYSGILKALTYFYEIKGNSTAKSGGGIGIVPYTYQQAYQYYYGIWLAKQKNENKNINDYVPMVEEITITPPMRQIKRPKLFCFLDEDEVEE